MLSRPLTGYLPLGTHAYHTPDSKCCQYLCRWSSAVIQMASAAHLGAWKLCRQERLPGSSSQIMDSVRIVRDARLHKAIVLQEGVIALGPIADEHLLSLHRPILKRQQPISLCQCTSRAVPRHIQELVSSHFIIYLCISGDSGCLQAQATPTEGPHLFEGALAADCEAILEVLKFHIALHKHKSP